MKVRSIRLYLSNEFGGVSAYLHHLWYLFLYTFRQYHFPSDTDFTKYTRIVFVCKGNICRSPYAEAKARQLGLNTLSAGLDTKRKKPANEKAISAASTRGIDLSSHCAKTLTDINILKTDLILVMEPSQIQQVRAITSAPDRSIGITTVFSKRPRPYLHDPYGHHEAYFQRCYSHIDDAVAELARICTGCHTLALTNPQ